MSGWTSESVILNDEMNNALTSVDSRDSTQIASTRLSRKQETALVALLAEPTHAAAASRAGVSEATLRRWLHQPEFSNAYLAARRSAFDDAIGSLQSLACKAVETLEKALTNPNPAICLKAAQLIIYNAFKGTEITDLAMRIEELEQSSQTQLADQS